MKYHDTFACIRLIMLLIVLATVSWLCLTETNDPATVTTPPAVSEPQEAPPAPEA